MPRPEVCEICNNKASLKLKNVTGIYMRDFSNWKYLCQSCIYPINRQLGTVICKGNDVLPSTVLAWVRRNMPKSYLCQICNNASACGVKNVTGIYNRGFINWKYTCWSCKARIDHVVRKVGVISQA